MESPGPGPELYRAAASPQGDETAVSPRRQACVVTIRRNPPHPESDA